LISIHCKALNELQSAARQLIEYASDQKIWVFKGNMGAGKTTFIKAIAKEFDIIDNVSSPTFSLVNEYQNNQNEVFFHFDFYRIESSEEVLEIGIDEYFYSGNYCWIEWAEKIPEFIPNHFVLIEMNVNDDQSREIGIRHV
jgi:tRNA threonylcarbamoyladenosine biosynthesis protein TsaE